MIIIRDAPGYMYSFLVNVHCPVSGWIPGMAAEYPVGKLATDNTIFVTQVK